MTTRRLQVSDIEDVIKLHQTMLPTTVSSRIGYGYLREVYKIVISHPETHLNYCAVYKGLLIGVITVSKNLGITHKMISPFSLHIFLPVGLAFIMGKVTFLELFQKINFERRVLKKFRAPQPYILTFFVARDYQRKGIGRKLMEKVMTEVKKRFDSLYVDTQLPNIPARAFYHAMGFAQMSVIYDSVILRKTLIGSINRRLKLS